jgi:hypothetical protein
MPVQGAVVAGTVLGSPMQQRNLAVQSNRLFGGLNVTVPAENCPSAPPTRPAAPVSWQRKGALLRATRRNWRKDK